MTTFHEDCTPLNPHEVEYPRLYNALDDLIKAYGLYNVQLALEILTEGR